ncbi:MAG: hypothetical protein DRN04_19060 [Thermoprotei archaeon]|nr:MAG: hypothetical protein DRN04_19060 [Thermoprotei archaeon]
MRNSFLIVARGVLNLFLKNWARLKGTFFKALAVMIVADVVSAIFSYYGVEILRTKYELSPLFYKLNMNWALFVMVTFLILVAFSMMLAVSGFRIALWALAGCKILNAIHDVLNVCFDIVIINPPTLLPVIIYLVIVFSVLADVIINLRGTFRYHKTSSKHVMNL